MMTRCKVLFVFLLIKTAGAEVGPAGFHEESISFYLDSNQTQIHSGKVRFYGHPKKKEKYPLCLVFGGFENAATVLDLLKPKVPIALATFDYPYRIPHKVTVLQAVKLAPQARRSVHATREAVIPFTERLLTDSRIDPKRVFIIGASFGAPFVISVAESPLFKAVILLYGFNDVESTISHLLQRRWERGIGFLSTPAAWISARAITLYLQFPELSAHIRRWDDHKSVLVITGKADEFIPSEVTQKLITEIKKSGAKATFIELEGNHLRPGAEAQLADLTMRVTNWLRASSMLTR